MHAVVLAAGDGKRLMPLTADRPKPMVLLNGRPLLEYVFDELPDDISDIILVVGYRNERIKEHFGDSYKGRPITYLEQKERLGTAHAVHMTRSLINEKFLLLNGDDIGDKASFEEGLMYDYCLFVSEHDEPHRFGVVEINADNILKRIVEKPEHPATNTVSTGTMVLSPKIFDIPLVQHPNGEHYIVDSLSGIMKEHPIQVLHQKSWITVTYPEDVPKTEALLKKRGK
jgi:bifunctional UDP-N-acetylglucosamine pyrophosphorylase/glucosamine-1-phosphate N-acetyltransferase